MIRLKTIDAHAGGEPLRLIVDGYPAPQGRTMMARREWARKHADHLRRALMLEPRGHVDMYGAVLTEPVSPGADAGVLFMHNQGYSTMCGHGIIAVTTIALERGLLAPGGDGASVVYDSPAGTIRARAHFGGTEGARESLEPAESHRAPRVRSVSFLNVPSFVLHAGIAVHAAGRVLRADVAFGGAFFAIVDSESAGLPIDAAHLPELRRVGLEIVRAVERSHEVAHPVERAIAGVHGAIFTGPPGDERSDLRSVTVFADAAVDRSACGAGTAAVMAVIDAMGLLAEDRPFVQEGPIGTRLSGRVAARTAVGPLDAIVPEIEGSAWMTGEHSFVVHDDDPLADGFRL